MPKTNNTIVNTVGGEISPLMYGRIDLPIYAKALAKCENFICIPQGGTRFRTGTTHVKSSRLNRTGKLIPFQFNDSQAYVIEATHQRFRFYKDGGAVLETAKNITGVTNANPGVITSNAHGFSNGDEVYIASVGGTTRLNGRFYLVAGATANTFTLTTITGTAIDTTSYGTYTSGGTVSRVYEITTIYEEVDIPYLQFAQNADTMYISHINYPPGKLTRSGHTSWTLNNAYARTADPFVGSTDNINAATQANPCQLTTTAAHGLAVGDIISIASVGGMTQLNGNYYKVGTVPTTTTLTLQTIAGVNVDSTGYSAYTVGGVITASDKFPRAVSFLDTGRLMFGGTKTNPETIFASKAPSSGTTAFDNFTTGSGATDAVIFTLAPVHGKVDSIQWLANTAKSVVVGTFGSLRRVYGATEQEALSPTSVTAKSVNAFGCALTLPVSNGDSLFYIQRGNKRLRSMEFDIQIDGYTTADRNLVAEHLTQNGITQIVEQQGFPDIIWCVRNDGRLVGLTYKEKEDISGWHRHYLGGSHVDSNSVTQTFGKVISIGIMARSSAEGDQLWMLVERKIGADTIRSIEYFTDQVQYPVRQDFYTGDEDEDNESFRDALFEAQKDAVHLDMSVTFDGSDVATMTMTPGAGATVAGTTGVTFTAGSAVFTSSDVGKQIWKKYDGNGNGGGRAEITGYTSSTVVTCTIKSAFDSVSAIAAGNWFLTASTISGLDHLEGQTVYAVGDGGFLSDDGYAVASGSINLGQQVSKAVVGYKYDGMIETLNLAENSGSGSSQAKPRNLIKAAVRFVNTVGAKIGTDAYRLERIVFRSTSDLMGRPVPLFNGLKEEAYSDDWDLEEKKIFISQDTPAPCTVLSIDPYIKTTDE